MPVAARCCLEHSLGPSEITIDSTTCLKPLAWADKWAENKPRPEPWSVSSTFERYAAVGLDPFDVADHADVYVSPDKRLRTGFSVVDHGRALTLTVASSRVVEAVNAAL